MAARVEGAALPVGPAAHGDLGVFLAVVERGSLTAAAAALGVSVSHVSRRLRALEDGLGVRLLERTTRQVQLTRAGRAYQERVGPLVEALDEAAREAARLQEEPRGTLRIALPATFGRHYLTGPIAQFLARWPEVRVEARYRDRTVDLVAEGFDLGIRGVAHLDESLVARRLLPFRGVCVASPAYLARRGVPAHPAELEGHDCLVNVGLRTMPGWEFRQGERSVRLAVRGAFAADDGDALVGAAVAGLGIAYEPDFLVAEALATGALVRIFADWAPWEGTLWAVYAHRAHLPARVRLFIDHLRACWPEAPWGAIAAAGGPA